MKNIKNTLISKLGRLFWDKPITIVKKELPTGVTVIKEIYPSKTIIKIEKDEF